MQIYPDEQQPAKDPLGITGTIAWVNLSPTVDREQSGHRPALVISSPIYQQLIDSMVVVIPITRTNRRWSNHIHIQLDDQLEGWAMTEQPRTISRKRVTKIIGSASPDEIAQVAKWLRRFIINYPPRYQ